MATETIIERQSTGVLLHLVQHIHDHDLGTPLNITPPSYGDPCFSLSVAAASFSAWLASDLVEQVEEEETRLVNGHAIVSVTVRFAGLILVRLTCARRVLEVVPA